MPTKRVPLNRTQHARINPACVKLWKTINEIYDAGEPESRRDELRDAETTLHRMLGLAPWHPFVTWVDSEGPPEKWQDPERHALVQQLRRALEAAAAQDGGAD